MSRSDDTWEASRQLDQHKAHVRDHVDPENYSIFAGEDDVLTASNDEVDANCEVNLVDRKSSSSSNLGDDS